MVNSKGLPGVDFFEFSETPDLDVDIESLLQTPYFYEQGLVVRINETGTTEILTSMSDLFKYPDSTIKLEGMERLSPSFHRLTEQLKNEFNHDGPVTAHIFISPKNGVTFPYHKDLEPVLVYVLEGQKNIAVKDNDEYVYTLLKQQGLFIPEGVYHKAVNEQASVMISFGFECWLKERCL